MCWWLERVRIRIKMEVFFLLEERKVIMVSVEIVELVGSGGASL